MFVNSTPHRRFTQSLGWPLSTYEILDFTLEKYGHELLAKGPTPYLFSVEPDGTAMRLWFFNDSALYFHRLLSSKLADPARLVSQFWWHCVKRSVIKAFRAFSARKFFYFSIDDKRRFYAALRTLNCTHKNGQEEKQESKKQDKSGFWKRWRYPEVRTGGFSKTHKAGQAAI